MKEIQISTVVDNIKQPENNFTFASKDKDYVREYNKKYYRAVTKRRNEEKAINELAMIFSAIDPMAFDCDEVYSFAKYVLENAPEYENTLKRIVRICEKNPHAFFRFRAKTLLLNVLVDDIKK